ncbi:MAG: transketolase [Chloroflexi bacterium]|nr:MAG: transketolase [Chloroflexota bacterium]
MAKVVKRPATKTSFLTPGGRTLPADEILADYRLAVRSRAASVIGRREVLTGKAGFGIFGDGKEIPQLALAKCFRDGDWRAGYYRDQTLMFATGMSDLSQFFAQLYAATDPKLEPASRGRQMPSHFATRFLDDDGSWLPQIAMKNSSADVSSVGGQMARLLGLSYASKLYRLNAELRERMKSFSIRGEEVAFGTIGDAGTSEGIFWEAMNAAAVLQVPMAVSVWDDGFGISVPREIQTAKSSISAALSGMARDGGPGFEIRVVRGWDYPALIDTYADVVALVRSDHVPALIHVIECTQPQGHSTSGSHERYKSKERLRWEEEFDGIRRMREWLIGEGLATAEQLDRFEQEDKRAVEAVREEAWEGYQRPIRAERDHVAGLLERVAQERPDAGVDALVSELRSATEATRRLVAASLSRAVVLTRGVETPSRSELAALSGEYELANRKRYALHLYCETERAALRVAPVGAEYAAASESVDGRVVLQRNFDALFARDGRVFAIGEDVGKLGDVNLVYEGLQRKYGELRVTDTGIREASILGQGIGSALRGLRPIVDIQYIDYLLFALEVLSDDLATLRYRTAGGQAAPVIVRTKGHRLQGIWHTGSPMGMILGSSRGVYLCVPRDCTRAAGFYNTLLRADDPAIVVEVLNAYRLKERLPENLGEFTVPLGVADSVRLGRDVTIVTYGACVHIALDAADDLAAIGIEAEVLDVQTLEPFDLEGAAARSVRKTNAVVFLDEDFPGGATAYMARHVLERDGAWDALDATPRTITALANRSPYAQDGDYFVKPNRERVVEVVYDLMRERFPDRYPALR